MKKIYAILAISLFVLSIAITTLSSAKDTTQREQIIPDSSSIPDSINKIFTNSCFPCHSDVGKLLAKTKLNFSVWDTYTKKEKIKVREDICKILSDGDMPPESVRKSKPETLPNDAQIKSICNWVASLNQEQK
jgi:hypothetical protein